MTQAQADAITAAVTALVQAIVANQPSGHQAQEAAVVLSAALVAAS